MHTICCLKGQDALIHLYKVLIRLNLFDILSVVSCGFDKSLHVWCNSLKESAAVNFLTRGTRPNSLQVKDLSPHWNTHHAALLQAAEMFMLPVYCITQVTQTGEEQPNKTNSEELKNTAVCKTTLAETSGTCTSCACYQSVQTYIYIQA